MRLLYGILLYTIFTILFCACKNNEKEEHIPIDKFAFIEQVINVSFCTQSLDCIEDSINNVASGVFIGANYEEETSQILTANHLCTSPEKDVANTAKNFPNMIVSVNSYSFLVNDQLGNQYSANVIRQNSFNDLCLLEINSTSIEPIGFYKEQLKQSEHIINISAPSGIWDPNAIIVFDGRFNGINQQNLSVYSLPTHPGSSGSPILTVDGELAGIINLAATTGSVGYGANQNDVIDFVSQP